MNDIHNRSKRKIDDIRSRLYERSAPPPQRTETQLVDNPEPVAETWSEPPQPKAEYVEPAPAEPTSPQPPMSPTLRTKASVRRRKFRRLVLLCAGLFFVGAVVLSTIVMMFGGGGISAENISISVNGPFTIGGGEVLTMQVGVTNANAVPISAATLIVDYPEGTRSAEAEESVFIERISLETIRAGETINVPVRARVFGQENSDQEIAVAIEYRVEGSNATFFREAEPFRYKISSAPVVVQAAANQRISSGQETDIVLTVSSNSPNTVSDVLVTADYPVGFDYTTAEPRPVRGQNTWRIETLEPSEEQTITIRGAMAGNEDDTLAMHFSVGAPDPNDPTAVASIFSTVSTEFLIEQPFVDIELELDGDVVDTIVVEPGRTLNGRITVTNNLSDIIYDTEVRLNLGGNALSDPAVSQTDGFYDSLNNVITWAPSSRERLTQMQPGESVSLTFSVASDETVRQTPAISLAAELESRRVRENRVPEILTGSTAATIQVASIPNLLAEARRTSGPVPPTVDETTNYTISLLAETASNNLNNVVVTTTLPQYVVFGEQLSERGDIAYNETTRTVTWTVGNVETGTPAVGSFSVSFRPSVSQIGDIPILINEQRLRAEDAFTGSVVRAEQDAVSTELSTELGFEPGNGRVIE